MIIITGITLNIFTRKAVVMKFPRKTTVNINGKVPNPKRNIKSELCHIPPAAKEAVKAI